MKKPRLEGRKVTKKVVWNRYRYPEGLIDTSSFIGRVCWWNYAALSKTDKREPLGMDCVARRYGWDDVVAVGLTQNWEIEKVRQAARDVLHVAMSPYLAWIMSEKKNLWCNTVYIPAAMSAEFTYPEANWVLLKILEIAESPQSWIEAAKNSAKDWIYILVDRGLRRRLHDIHPRNVLGHFPDHEWDHEILLMESELWINPKHKLWSVALEKQIVPMLFKRKQTSVESSSSSS